MPGVIWVEIGRACWGNPHAWLPYARPMRTEILRGGEVFRQVSTTRRRGADPRRRCRIQAMPKDLGATKSVGLGERFRFDPSSHISVCLSGLYFSHKADCADSVHVVADHDHIVDVVSGEGAGRAGDRSPGAARSRGRPWLAIRWRCCGAYSRMYRNRAGNAYEGFCPRCARPVRIKIAADGSDVRLFDAW